MDVGCGFGNITIPVASLGYNVLGIDIDGKAIQRAIELNPFPNVKFEHITVEELRGEVFEVLILTKVLEHVEFPRRFMRVLGELCKPGSILLMTVPNGYGPRELVLPRQCYIRLVVTHGV